MNISGWQGNFVPAVRTSIAQGAQESSPIYTGGMDLVGVQIPAVMTGTAITFTVGDAEDGFQASGQVAFSGTCTDGDTLHINGVLITFVDADPGDGEVLIGATAAETASNLFDYLSDTEDDDLLACTYVLEGAIVLVTAVVHGTDGNAYTFSKSSTDIALSPAGGFLSGGGFRALYNDSNTLISITVAAGRTYAIDPKYFQSIQWFKVKSGSAEAAGRVLTVTLKGI